MTKLNLSHNKFAEKSGVAIGKWIGIYALNLLCIHITKQNIYLS